MLSWIAICLIDIVFSSSNLVITLHDLFAVSFPFGKEALLYE